MRGVLSWKRAPARSPAVKHWHRLRVAIAGFMAAMLMPLAAATSGSADPPVPAGRNPGGYPVAIIGAGIDYTLRNISQMLARDGEGEIIGYDLVDDDRRPYATGQETDAAEILLGEGQAATLVVVRTNVLEQQRLAAAIGYAAQSPARIIAIFASASDPGVAAVLAAASQKFPQHLFVASLDAGTAADLGTTRAANLLIVTNAITGDIPSGGARGGTAADVAIETSGLWERPASLPEAPALPAQIALARTAALAARLIAVDTRATAAELKSRIVALAEPLPDARKFLAQNGWISEPRRHFWLD